MFFVSKKTLYLSTLVAVLSVVVVFFSNYKSLKKSEQVEIWAEQNKIVLDKTKHQPKPFKIEFDQKEWDLLLQKLELTRYFEGLDNKYVEKYNTAY